MPQKRQVRLTVGIGKERGGGLALTPVSGSDPLCVDGHHVRLRLLTIRDVQARPSGPGMPVGNHHGILSLG